MIEAVLSFLSIVARFAVALFGIFGIYLFTLSLRTGHDKDALFGAFFICIAIAFFFDVI